MGVWIGAIRTSGSETEFEWEVDGSKVDYSNWAVDSPIPIVGRDCVAMQSRFSKIPAIATIEPEDGQWKDVLCEVPNYFVCESVPTWSIDDIKRVLIDTRNALGMTIEELKETKEELKEAKEKLSSEVENLQKNPVPVGFIYYEHHGQPAPQSLWPGVTWKDVTLEYAGLFFRALGGGSDEFGNVQVGDSPRLTQVEVRHSQPYRFQEVVPIPSGSWSDWMFTGTSGSVNHQYAHRVYISNPEIRPKNAAIRIWRREA